MIEAFASHASDPSFGITIGLRRPDRRQHDLDVFSGEHFVEGSGELRVPISNQEPDSSDIGFIESDEEVAGLLGDPGAVGFAGDTETQDASRLQVQEEQHVDRLEPHGLNGEEVAGDDTSCLRTHELPPRRTVSPRGRPEPRTTKERADRGGGDSDAEFAQLALDAHASPMWVLARQPKDQLASFQINRWPSRAASIRKGPFATDELAVPAQQRLRRDQQGTPTVPRQHPANRRQEDLVASSQLRPRDLPSKHRQLMAQNENLDLSRRRATHRTKYPTKQEVDDGKQHGAAWYGTPAQRANPNICAPQRTALSITSIDMTHDRYRLPPNLPFSLAISSDQFRSLHRDKIGTTVHNIVV